MACIAWSAAYVSLEPPDEAAPQAPGKRRKAPPDKYENIVNKKARKWKTSAAVPVEYLMIRIDR